MAQADWDNIRIPRDLSKLLDAFVKDERRRVGHISKSSVATSAIRAYVDARLNGRAPADTIASMGAPGPPANPETRHGIDQT
ncbi:MAG: hypothetical protein QOC71_1937 [Thermoplasmata archaeon]|jgi:hypothetical protein|nr:hypothetical protein [Thermoplasmata archaeon]